jgi:ABC-2 type transport system ATP-binding protein
MANQDVVAKVENLKKDFILPHSKNTSFKHVLVNIFSRSRKSTQHVLKGISFEVEKGDFYGIVGRNGSGKSTLLKILAGVYSPTSGAADLFGSLTPFIELGVGFNPELSGRDNVYLNGALLGFNRKQMDAMYDDIVEFAELGRFMDQKLKNYSSGMQVRLAFSIAIKAKNDILIFDEVLAVGDEAFQRKCLDVFERYKAEGQTVILVTHDMDTVRKFCNKALLISDGEIKVIGDPQAVANEYSRLNQDQIDKETSSINEKQVKAKYIKIQLRDVTGKKAQSFQSGEYLDVNLRWPGLDESRIESIGVNIFKQSGEHITGINSRFSKHSKNWKSHSEITLRFKLDIAGGSYYVLPEIFQAEGERVDSLVDGPKFIVKPNGVTWSGLVELPYEWIEDVQQ